MDIFSYFSLDTTLLCLIFVLMWILFKLKWIILTYVTWTVFCYDVLRIFFVILFVIIVLIESTKAA